MSKKILKELEEIIKLKDIRISELERILELREYDEPYIQYVPTPIPIDICFHEYPNPWGGIIPPNCKKYGKPALSPYTYGTAGGPLVGPMGGIGNAQ